MIEYNKNKIKTEDNTKHETIILHSSFIFAIGWHIDTQAKPCIKEIK
ncbi:MAG: hypothetical protein ACI90V_012078 [Bacillariaceae sp.]|jgi:hypothetical protein